MACARIATLDPVSGGLTLSQLPTSVVSVGSAAQGDVGGQWNGSAWIKDGGAPATPEAFGALGDGATDDTIALQAWLASGKYAALTPGKTYLHRKPLNATVRGQQIRGNGATLKAAAQVSTTTTTAVSAGVTNQITVASSAGLKVGDWLVLEQPGVSTTLSSGLTAGAAVTSLPVAALGTGIASSTLIQVVSGSHVQQFNCNTLTSAGATSIPVDPQFAVYSFPGGSTASTSGTWDLTIFDGRAAIQSILGNVVTVTGTFGQSFTGTTNVHTAIPPQLYITADDVDVSGMLLDGNSANATYTRWSTHGGIWAVGAKNPYVHHNRLINQCGDAFSPDNCINAVFAFNYVDTVTGRGFTFGSSTGFTGDIGSKCLYNRFYNCETNPLASGNDQHGSVNFSDGGLDSLVLGNLIDTGIVGVGGLAHGDADRRIRIAQNTIENCGMAAIEGTAASVTGEIHVKVHDNTITSCGPIIFYQPLSAQTGSVNIQIHDNTLSESTILIRFATGVSVHHNHLVSAGSAGQAIWLTFIGSSGTIQASVHGNQVWGFDTAIVIDSNSRNVSVAQNQCFNQRSYGIRLNTTVNPPTTGIAAAHNRIVAPASAAAFYRGIDATGQADIESNDIDLSAISGGTTNMIGLYIEPDFSAIVRAISNRINVGSSGTSPLTVKSGTTTATLKNNFMDAAYTDSGTGTVKRGNTPPTSTVQTGLSYGTNYADFGGGERPGQWWLDDAGFVHVAGTIKRSTAWLLGNPIATLPAGARPGFASYVWTMLNDGTAGRVSALIGVATNGQISIVFTVPTVATPANLSSLLLDNLTFQQIN